MYTKLLIALFILLFFSGASQAALAENSLKITLIKYDPYPVSPDSDFSMWVQLENVGDNDISAVSIELVQKYPFSIKSGDNSVKYPGTIRKNDKKLYMFSVHIDKNALVGTNKIEIGYRVDNVFTKNEFDIEVGTDVVDAKGTVRLEKYSLSLRCSWEEKPKANPGKVILNIANNRPNTLQAVTVIPSGNVTFEPAEYFIGTMESDELFTVKFDLISGNPDNVSFNLRFKNGNNWHESKAMSVALDGSKDTRSENNSPTILPVLVILGAALVMIAGFFVYMRRRRAKSG